MCLLLAAKIQSEPKGHSCRATREIRHCLPAGNMGTDESFASGSGAYQQCQCEQSQSQYSPRIKQGMILPFVAQPRGRVVVAAEELRSCAGAGATIATTRVQEWRPAAEAPVRSNAGATDGEAVDL